MYIRTCQEAGKHSSLMYTSVYACSLLLLAYGTIPPPHVLCDILIADYFFLWVLIKFFFCEVYRADDGCQYYCDY
jgi:hypothetical protein